MKIMEEIKMPICFNQDLIKFKHNLNADNYYAIALLEELGFVDPSEYLIDRVEAFLQKVRKDAED